MDFHIDNFDNPNCKAGGEHQWLGDGLIHFSDGKSMSERKYNLLSPKMQKEYDIVGCECTCNKCGIAYTQAFNPMF
jgi:hypothetical protein